MLKIAICDDEESMLVQLKKSILNYQEDCKNKFEIICYCTGQKFLEDFREYEFDAVFLDVEMPQMSGMKIAEKIRHMNPYIKIIFISNYKDKVYESLQYTPFRFIRKEKVSEELKEAVTSLVQQIKTENITLQILVNGTQYMLSSEHIMYVCSNQHYLNIVTEQSEFTFRGKLQMYQDVLQKVSFIRCHVGYLVNPKYIDYIGKTDILLDGGDKIPLSRNRREIVKEEYQRYVWSRR